MKKYLYSLSLTTIVSNGMLLKTEDAIDLFAEGLKTLASNSLAIEKEKEVISKIDTSLGAKLLSELNKNNYTAIINEFKKNQYSVNNLKASNFDKLPPQNSALAKVIMTLKLQTDVSLKQLALALINKYKEDGAIDFEITDSSSTTTTPLLEAIDIGDVEIVDALLSKGANPLKITKQADGEKMPLTTAIDKNTNDNKDFKNIALALIKKADQNNIDTKIKENITKNEDDIEISYKETTPLHKATKRQDIEIIDALLKKDANPLHKTINYSNRKDSTYKNEHTPLTDILDSLYPNTNNIKNIALKLIKNINPQDVNTPIKTATNRSSSKDYSFHSLPPLEFAVKTSDLDVVNALLDKNAKPTSEIKWQVDTGTYTSTPLISSLSAFYNQDIATALINKLSKSDVNLSGNKDRITDETTPLLLAISKNDIKNIKLLLDKGADPLQKVGDKHETALYHMFLKIKSSNTNNSDAFKKIVLEIFKKYKDDKVDVDKSMDIYEPTNFDKKKTILQMLTEIPDQNFNNQLLNLLK